MTTSDIRHLFSHPLALALAIACVTAVTAQQPAPPPVDRAALERQAEINKQPDTPGTGRFAAMKEEVASLPRHVVYRPTDLAALGGTKLGVVAWGNGGCSDDGVSSRFHLLEIASHGYLVIASGRILSGPGAPPREPRPDAQPGQIPPPRTQPSDLSEAVDWRSRRTSGPAARTSAASIRRSSPIRAGVVAACRRCRSRRTRASRRWCSTTLAC